MTSATSPTQSHFDFGRDARVALLAAALLCAGCSSESSNPAAGPDASSGGTAGSVATGGSAGVGSGGTAGQSTGGAAGSSTGGAAGSAGCPGNQVSCGGTCMDVATDPANCGSCGHDCLGSTCSSGGCKPETVALIGSVQGLAVDSTHVYFTQSGSPVGSSFVKKVEKAGGTPVELANAQNSPKQIFADDKLYWGGAVYVRRADKDGANPQTLTLFRPNELRQNNTLLALSVTVLSPLGYEIRKVNKAGNGEGLIWSETGFQPGELALSGSDAFWTVSAGKDIYKKPVSGVATAKPSVLASEAAPVKDLSVESSDLFWTVQTNNSWQIHSAALDGTNPKTLVSSTSNAQLQLVPDPAGLYWIETVSGIRVLRAANRDGTNVRTLSADLGPSPQALVLDAQHAYYATSGGIFRVAR